MWRIRSLVLAVGLAIWGDAVWAGEIVLRVTDAGTGATTGFTREELAALPQTRYRTATRFTDGRPLFAGPLARDVLRASGVENADIVVVTAANDYVIKIPFTDLTAYDVIMSITMNDRPLTLRDKGPIWLMYPLDRHAELSDPIYSGRLIWQMIQIEAR